MRDFLKKFRFALDEQNISMALGVLVVILVGSLLFNYFKSVNSTPTGDTTSTSTEVTATSLPTMAELPKDYQIQKGDSLWTISEKVYGSGYNWTDVYQANKQVIGNADLLAEGTTITLPKVEVKVTPTQTTETKTVEYTTVKGDYLWKIAINTCNNGYLWPAIAKANALRNPNYLEVGQKLTITCN